MSTQSPKCRLCGHIHPLGAPHIWDTEKPSKKVATKPEIVATIKEKVATITEKPKNVATIRRISIRQLNQGISKHFSDLPFEVTKNGKVIARVEKP
jgi:hypothetical protein